MKKGIVGALLLLGWAAGRAVAQNGVPAATPPKDASRYVEVDDADHDFGNILFKKPVDYTVHIQNISTDTLTLSNVTVSCGCTIPEWKRGPYAPRDTFSVKIAFNGYADGKFVRTLTLLFNDKSHENIVKVLCFRGVGYQKLPVAQDNSMDGMDDDDADTVAMSKTEQQRMVKKT